MADTVGVYVFVIVWTIYVIVLVDVADKESVFVFIPVLLIIDDLLDEIDTVDVFDIVDELDTVFVFIIVNDRFGELDMIGDRLVVFDWDVELVIVGVLDTVFVVLVDFVFVTVPVDVFDDKLLNEYDGDFVLIVEYVLLRVARLADDKDADTVFVFVILADDVELLDTLEVGVFVLDDIIDLVTVGVEDVVLVYITDPVDVNVPIKTVFVAIVVRELETDTVDVLLAPDDFVFVRVVNSDTVNIGV